MMTLILASLERHDRLRSVQDRFAESDPHVFQKVMMVVALVSAILALIWLMGRVQRRRIQQIVTPQPFGLFFRVQAKLALPWLDRWRLWRLARVLRTREPTALLISPVLFDEAVKLYCEGHSLLGRRLGKAACYAVIRQRLFGDSMPEASISHLEPAP